MKRKLNTWRPRLALLTVAGIIAGCQTGQKVDDGGARAREEAFHEHLVQTTEAISLGDLALAGDLLDEARTVSFKPEHTIKVDSLEMLIVGATALMKGDVDEAQSRFASIEDTALCLEVRDRALDIGLDVPERVTTSEER